MCQKYQMVKITEKIYVYSFLLMDNNNVIEIEVPLTEKGTEEIEQVLFLWEFCTIFFKLKIKILKS